MTKDSHKEMTELTHEADPTYRKLFYIVFMLLFIYLGYILWNTL